MHFTFCSVNETNLGDVTGFQIDEKIVKVLSSCSENIFDLYSNRFRPMDSSSGWSKCQRAVTPLSESDAYSHRHTACVRLTEGRNRSLMLTPAWRGLHRPKPVAVKVKYILWTGRQHPFFPFLFPYLVSLVRVHRCREARGSPPRCVTQIPAGVDLAPLFDGSGRGQFWGHILIASHNGASFGLPAAPAPVTYLLSTTYVVDFLEDVVLEHHMPDFFLLLRKTTYLLFLTRTWQVRIALKWVRYRRGSRCLVQD